MAKKFKSTLKPNSLRPLTAARKATSSPVSPASKMRDTAVEMLRPASAARAFSGGNGAQPAPLDETERAELMRLIQNRLPLPRYWRGRLFPESTPPPTAETGKEYRLTYDGKMKREEVLARTPAAPWQLVRSFCEDRPHTDGWRNLLVWGDNLLALRELLSDQQGPNRFKTRGKIKLIYIDPPFATRQDFMKDKEKAYRDKVLGAQFIEFLRRRLILLRELLADDGFIFVHMDAKKVHYIKAVMDEAFDETNFRNEIVLPRPFTKNLQQQFKMVSSLNVRHDTLLCYSKETETKFRPLWISKEVVLHPEGHWHHFWSTANRPTMRYELFGITPKTGQWVWGEKRGRQAVANYDHYLAEVAPKGQSLVEYWLETGKSLRFVRKDEEGKPQYWRAPADQVLADTIWHNVLTYENQKIYATQKHEDLLGRIIRGYSNEGDIVLDSFAGSGTTPAVAEKLNRRWIAMDCGKLAIYTMQKRMFSLTNVVGATTTDDRAEPERVDDWAQHLRSAPAVLLITEKARKGECEVTLQLLQELAAILKREDWMRQDAQFSVICPERKLRISRDALEEPDEGPGDKSITIDGVDFRISFVVEREKPQKEQPLPVKAFSLYRAGVYDMDAVEELAWEEYRAFVLKLFGVRDAPDKRYGFPLDGTLGTDPVIVWNFPASKNTTIDHGYVDDLHRTLRGRPGERFLIIAPTAAVDFAEDEVPCDKTTYVFLRVPESVLRRLIQKGADAALKQPTKEADVNEVIDAVGFDFIQQPQVIVKAHKKKPRGQMFTEYILELSEFRARTLATEPEDYENFETFSMAMLDLNYDGKVFHLGRVFWADDLINEAGGLEKAEALELRIPQAEFTGDRLMAILCDRYGNEKSLVFKKGDFR